LAGRRDLIASAALQMLDMDVRPTGFVAPAAFFGNSQPSVLPRHGIGRGFKASKEAIVGLMVALAEFVERDHGDWHAATHTRLLRLQERLANLSGISTEIIPGRRVAALPRLAIDIQSAKRAERVCRRLMERSPSVRLGEGQIAKGTLIVDLLATDESDDEQLGLALREVFNALPLG
jgi:L-seryl-tRNA(Ser) seleniumtransferase